jgi:hypothetical protein
LSGVGFEVLKKCLISLIVSVAHCHLIYFDASDLDQSAAG